MARKKKPEEHENHERWLVSYADFITLLFAFFVVMYALSTVNEGKYKVLSDSLIHAFRTPPRSIKPIQVGDPVVAPEDVMQDIRPDPQVIQAIRIPVPVQRRIDQAGGKAAEKDKENMKRIANKLEQALSKMMERDLITVTKSDKWIEVEINSSILFSSGSSLLQPKAVPVLTEIAGILKDFPNAIRVEGFTDNVPIETPYFPSNWELSAGRSASVVHLFSDEGVDPFQLSAIGFGEFRPKVANDSEAGRRQNRRVVVVILSEEAAKLYNRENIKSIDDSGIPTKDVDLDAPVPEFEPVDEVTQTDLPLPDGMPQNLNLKSRKERVRDKEAEKRFEDMMENIGFGSDKNKATDGGQAR